MDNSSVEDTCSKCWISDPSGNQMKCKHCENLIFIPQNLCWKCAVKLARCKFCMQHLAECNCNNDKCIPVKLKNLN